MMFLVADQLEKYDESTVHLNLFNYDTLLLWMEQTERKGKRGRKRVKRDDFQEVSAVKLARQEGEVEDEGWVVVGKKADGVAVSVSDHSKLTRYYSHKSIQNYLKFLLLQSAPNPMWLNIRRQSQIQMVIYIDLEIENNLFESMLQEKQLPFISSIMVEGSLATFRPSGRVYREDLWETLLGYDGEGKLQQLGQQKTFNELPPNLSQQLYLKYAKSILTPAQLKLHLYPDRSLPLYADFHVPILNEAAIVPLKNHILVIDCEMVSSAQGFQLARATIMNFEGEILFDELFKPIVKIFNYNTEYSGITAQMLQNITNTIQNKLHPFLDSLFTANTILVGHSLENDLRAMHIIHHQIIDTSVLFQRKNGTKFKLKSLAQKILKRRIQNGEHDSAEDCLATLHLLRCRIENDHTIRKREYDLLKELAAAKKNAAIIDYAIDYDMKEYAANHYDQVDKNSNAEDILRVARKYVQKGVANPTLLLTRIERNEQKEWEQHYLEFDAAFNKLYSQLSSKTLLFVNCQINPHIQIVASGGKLKPQSTSRSPTLIFAL